jgi:hypothetical protein
LRRCGHVERKGKERNKCKRRLTKEIFEAAWDGNDGNSEGSSERFMIRLIKSYIKAR